jgi:hypothetical protein
MMMLCVTVDDHRLPPYIILYLKTVHRNESFHKNVMCVTKNVWTRTHFMVEWVKIVWERRFGTLLNPLNMSVVESFRAHVSEEVIFQLERKNCYLVVITFGIIS